MSKIVGLDKIAGFFKDDMVLMSGGFMGCGASDYILEFITTLGLRNVTLISSDTAMPGKGSGLLISSGCVKKLIASHIGTNPETGKLMNDNIINVELVPQGTLAERIRAGGFGLGGILTPTGVGTIVQDGKQIIELDDQEYLLETSLKSDVSILKGSIVDTCGNVFYSGTTRNFNPVMAMAGDIVIVEAEKIVPAGELKAECIMTPGNLVDYIVQRSGA